MQTFTPEELNLILQITNAVQITGKDAMAIAMLQQKIAMMSKMSPETPQASVEKENGKDSK